MKVGTTQSLQSFDNLPGKQPISAIMLRLSGWNGPLNLGVQVEVEGLGIIGRVPLTVNCHESSDDFTLAPGGGVQRIYMAVKLNKKLSQPPSGSNKNILNDLRILHFNRCQLHDL